MPNLTNPKLIEFIESQIVVPFYSSRFNSLNNKTLEDLLKTKNPYLFRVKNPIVVADYVKQMLDAFLSSSEETIFGKSLEKLAVYVCGIEFGGYKPSEGEFPSIDLIFENKNTLYIVGIKSGSVWGNADSINKMIENIHKSSKIFKTQGYTKIELVSGICYGQSKITENKIAKSKLTYKKYFGKEFWELISGDKDFYRTIVIPIGQAIKGRDLDYKDQYDKKINELTQQMFEKYTLNSQINWELIVEVNSGIKTSKS